MATAQSHTRLATKAASVVVAIALVSGCAATQDAVTQPPTSSAAASGAQVAPVSGSSGSINRDFPEELNEWFRDPVQNKVAEYSKEKVASLVEKAAGKAIAKILSEATGGIIGYAFGWLFGTSDSQQDALDRQFAIVQEKLDKLSASVDKLDASQTAGFNKLKRKINEKECADAKAAIKPYSTTIDNAMSQTQQFMDAAKGDPNSKATAEALEAFNAQYLDELAPLAKDPNYLVNYVNGIAGDKGVLVSCYNLVAGDSPIITNDASKIMLSTWAYYYAQFRTLSDIYLAYWTGKYQNDSKSAAKLKGIQTGAVSMDSIMMDRYPLQVPEKTLYDTKTGIWFNPGLQGGYDALNVLWQELSAGEASVQQWATKQEGDQYNTWIATNKELQPILPERMNKETADRLYERLRKDTTLSAKGNDGSKISAVVSGLALGDSKIKFAGMVGIQYAPPVAGKVKLEMCELGGIQNYHDQFCTLSKTDKALVTGIKKAGSVNWDKANLLNGQQLGAPCADIRRAAVVSDQVRSEDIAQILILGSAVAETGKRCGDSTPWIAFASYPTAREMFVNVQPRNYDLQPSVSAVPSVNVPRPIAVS